MFNDRFYSETLNNENPTLINKLNIRDYNKLQEAELIFSIGNLFNLSVCPIKGNWDFDHLKKYHKYIFGDLYDFAGNIRRYDVIKYEEVLSGASVDYAKVEDIEANVDYHLLNFLKHDFAKLSHKEKTILFCDALVGVWKAHPFNEGNTRTITKFMCDLASFKGLDMNIVLFGDNADYFRRSMVVYSYGKNEYLEKIIGDAISQGKQNIVSTKDLPILVNQFVKGKIKKENLINKKFYSEGEQYQIIDLQKNKGQANANALIFNCDTREIYLEKDFARNVKFTLKLNQKINNIEEIKKKEMWLDE